MLVGLLRKRLNRANASIKKDLAGFILPGSILKVLEVLILFLIIVLRLELLSSGHRNSRGWIVETMGIIQH